MNKRVLILDDDDDILNILSILLLENGYEIQTLSSGENIFQEIKEFAPDLVVMDVMLADMDGRKICRELKSSYDTKTLPVILISGTHDLANSLNQQGAPNDFVAKPFDLDYFLNKVALQFAAK